MSNFKVPYVDIPTEIRPQKHLILDAVSKVLESGRYIQGPEVEEFEKKFAGICQTKFATGVASGTCALHLLFRKLDLKNSDEVITVPNSFIASAAAIATSGGTPKFVDIGEDGNIDIDKLESAINKKTKAILPVHLTGRPARIDQIMELVRDKSILVIEDAAQAVGAKLNGKAVGSLGHAACFSLHPLKNMRVFGDGGMLTSSDEEIIQFIAKMKNHGLANREQCDFWGFNCRLDELHAAMLNVQLDRFNELTNLRRQIAFRYNDGLKEFVEVPKENDGEFCVYQTYVIKTTRRDELQNFLRDNGVEALIHYKNPIFSQPSAKNLECRPEQFPETLKHCEMILSLPIYPTMTSDAQEYVIEKIKMFFTR